MTDQEIEDAIRGFLKSWIAGDLKRIPFRFSQKMH
jgi:hypothetical protein